jgi:hypothetical protein
MPDFGGRSGGFGDRVVSEICKVVAKKKGNESNSLTRSQAAESDLKYSQAVEIGLARSQAVVSFRNFLLLVGNFAIREKEER